jgi:hypothetical protein
MDKNVLIINRNSITINDYIDSLVTSQLKLRRHFIQYNVQGSKVRQVLST